MTWNHRVLVDRRGDDEPLYEVVEMYYDDEGNPNGHCEAGIFGSSATELGVSAGLQIKALSKPWLEILSVDGKRGKVKYIPYPNERNETCETPATHPVSNRADQTTSQTISGSPTTSETEAGAPSGASEPTSQTAQHGS